MWFEFTSELFRITYHTRTSIRLKLLSKVSEWSYERCMKILSSKIIFSLSLFCGLIFFLHNTRMPIKLIFHYYLLTYSLKNFYDVTVFLHFLSYSGTVLETIVLLTLFYISFIKRLLALSIASIRVSLFVYLCTSFCISIQLSICLHNFRSLTIFFP